MTRPTITAVLGAGVLIHLLSCGGGGGSANPAINNPPVTPVVRAENFSVAEGDSGQTTLNITVTLSSSSTEQVSVNYSTADDTAVAGTDYESAEGNLRFAAGVTSATISITINGDRLDEEDEIFTLNFSNATNATLGTALARGTINDDDDPPGASISNATQAEGNSGTTGMPFTISLSGESGKTLSLDYATSNGTALAASDYETSRGTVTFIPGQSTQAIEVDIIGDQTDEFDETFTVTLINPVNVSIASASAAGTIIDDDEAPSASVIDVGAPEPDTGISLLTMTVLLSAPSGKPITLNYATADNSATTTGGDYVPSSGSLEIAPGTTGGIISLQINGDTQDEVDETLFVDLSGGINVTIANSRAEATIYNNDGVKPASGLAARPVNVTCVAPDRPTENAAIAIEPAFPELPELAQPVALLQAPGDSAQWFVVQQAGLILRFDDSADVNTTSTFIDLSEMVDASRSETGLLGMAFHPNYATNRYVYVSYTEAGPRSVLARYESADDGQTLNPESETRLITIDQPFGNHNGGHLVFGPDGYLYFGMGDGGSGGDPGDRAQNISNLFGTIMRIDVDANPPYTIPPDNSFAGNPLCTDGNGEDACPEIYAWGLRNPWRWHFDNATGQLWLGDVGQDNWEEIDIVEGGGNYGWRCREGAHDFDLSGVCPSGLIDPVIEYDDNEGNSITGGFVYRGAAIPELIGRYVFADFERGKVFAAVPDGAGGYGYEVLLDTTLNIVSFARQRDDELLILNYGGDIRRIIQSSGTSNNTIPALLSETGCVDPEDATRPSPGLIAYDINAPFWSDGAQKQRWYAIPDGTTVDVDDDGDWIFPNGSVLVKNFTLLGRLFETRLFMRHSDGTWAGYTYAWNNDGSDATRVIGGRTTMINGQSWVYPSESECMSCHTQAAGFSLGLEHRQLNRDFTYPPANTTANQLATAEFINVLTLPLADVPENLPRLADPQNTGAGFHDRARAYLHSNCANCHRPLGPTPADMDLRQYTDFAVTNTCNEIPVSGDLGISDARVISPGDAGSSILTNRTNRRDVHGMPPLASNVIDESGFALLTSWINSISQCP